MTLDEAFQAAAHLLDQRGQLLNAHLLRAVEGNKEYFREVRSRLIREGLAEDRAGVGLARTAVAITVPDDTEFRSASANSSAEPSIEFAAATDDDFVAFDTIEADWWLMSGGVIRGPLDLPALRLMQHHGEFKSADFVRRGKEGPWKQPDEVAELVVAGANDANHRSDRRESVARSSLAGSRKTGAAAGQPRSSSVQAPADSATGPDNNKRYVPPEKLWSAGHRQPGWISRSWRWAVDIAGGQRRLVGFLGSAVTIAVLYYWWQLLPSNAVIFDEYTTCHSALHKLHDRRAGRSEFAPLVEQYRPRVENLVSRLQTRASDRYPIQQELYLAGARGLLPWLDNPANASEAEHEFDKHMSLAKKLMADAAKGQSSTGAPSRSQ